MILPGHPHLRMLDGRFVYVTYFTSCQARFFFCIIACNNIISVIVIPIIYPGIFRSSHPGLFLGKGVLKICNQFTGEHPWWNVIFKNLQSNFIEIAVRHGSSPVNLLHIFRILFPRNTFGWVLFRFNHTRLLRLTTVIRLVRTREYITIFYRSKVIPNLYVLDSEWMALQTFEILTLTLHELF